MTENAKNSPPGGADVHTDGLPDEGLGEVCGASDKPYTVEKLALTKRAGNHLANCTVRFRLHPAGQLVAGG